MVTFKEVTAETDERPSEESEGAREPGSNTHTIQLKSSLSRPQKPPKTLPKRSNPARRTTFFAQPERGEL